MARLITMNSRQLYTSTKLKKRSQRKLLRKKSKLISCAQKPFRGIDTPLETLRKKLIARGARGILGLAKLFQSMDTANTGNITLEQYQKAIKDYKIAMDEAEAGCVFQCEDAEKAGAIAYLPLIKKLKVINSLSEYYM
jgi:hypothetical protein